MKKIWKKKREQTSLLNDVASFDLNLDEDEDGLSAEDLEDMEDIEDNDSAFRWIDAQTDDEFKTLYFSFNHYGIRADQKKSLNYDVEQLKQLLTESGYNRSTNRID